MSFKKFKCKQNKKFFRKTIPEKIGSLGINYHECCISCGGMFPAEKQSDGFVCEKCFGKRIEDCAKCGAEFLVREDDKIWDDYCLNCVYEW